MHELICLHSFLHHMPRYYIGKWYVNGVISISKSPLPSVTCTPLALHVYWYNYRLQWVAGSELINHIVFLQSCGLQNPLTTFFLWFFKFPLEGFFFFLSSFFSICFWKILYSIKLFCQFSKRYIMKLPFQNSFTLFSYKSFLVVNPYHQ